MKARVIATGETVDVVSNGLYYESIKDARIFDKSELEIMSKTKALDYWTRLEHQYAGMAMQALIIDASYAGNEGSKYLVEECIAIAHALVEKMKEVK